MKFEAGYVEENVNVSRRDYGREFLKLGAILMAITVAVYLILGFGAEQIVVHLPVSMEKKLGAAFDRQIDEKKFPETQAYAQKVLNRLVAVSEGIPAFDYRVDMVDHEMVNAVALPAGRIVLFRGLVDELGSEEALAMVLAHELGHYVHRDHLRGFGRGLVLMAIGMMFGTNGNVPNLVMPSITVLDLRFSREHEQTADFFALDTVVKAYGHVGGVLEIYDILEKKEPSRFSLPMFSTHPDTRQRQTDLRTRIESHQYAQGAATPLPGDGHLPFLKERAKDSNDSQNWKTVNEEYFSLQVPADMEKIPVQGVDSYVGHYKNSNMDINFDYGLYSDPLKFPQKPLKFREYTETIAGQKVKIVEYSKSGEKEFIVAAHFPKGGRAAKSGNKLTVSCTCQSDANVEIAKKIIRSIVFKE